MPDIKPYEGSEPYIFISYAHKNKPAVMPILEKLTADGYRIWYDKGIDPGTEWVKVIAKHIEKCTCFIAMLSPEYIKSDNCKDEIELARALKLPRVSVYISETALPIEMQMTLNRIQAVHKYKYDIEAEFYETFYKAEPLFPCKSETAEPIGTPSVNKYDIPPKSEIKPELKYEPKYEPQPIFTFTPNPTPVKHPAPEPKPEPPKLKSEPKPEKKPINSAYPIPSWARPGNDDSNSVKYDGTKVIGCDKTAKNVIIKNGTTEICEKAFFMCKELVSVFIPEGVTVIGESAFSNCEKLKYVSLPHSLESVGGYSFNCCKSLVFNEHGPIKYLGNSANPNLLLYSMSKSVTSVNLPYGLKIISGFAFSECRSISEIVLPESVVCICQGAFLNCEKLKSFFIPASVKKIFGYFLFNNCFALNEIGISKDNRSYKLKNNCLIENSTKKLILAFNAASIPSDEGITVIEEGAFYSCNTAKSLTVPEGVTTICKDAFAYNENLTSITLPESLTRIEAGAFKFCEKLSNIKLPLNLAYIGTYAFASCGITEIYIPFAAKTVEPEAFISCKSLKKASYGKFVMPKQSKVFSHCENISEIVLSPGIGSIPDSAFDWAPKLTSVTIPFSVESIGKRAFVGVTHIRYQGVIAEFKKIKKKFFWLVSPECEIKCTNGTINK